MILRMPDYPRTLLEFQHLFPDEAACARHLERIRWPEGFECPTCDQVGEPWRLQARPRVLECRHCGHQASLTAGTVMHRTRQSLPAGLVLGCVLSDDANAWYERSSVPTAARHQTLRDGVPDATQAACRDGSA